MTDYSNIEKEYQELLEIKSKLDKNPLMDSMDESNETTGLIFAEIIKDKIDAIQEPRDVNKARFFKDMNDIIGETHPTKKTHITKMYTVTPQKLDPDIYNPLLNDKYSQLEDSPNRLKQKLKSLKIISLTIPEMEKKLKKYKIFIDHLSTQPEINEKNIIKYKKKYRKMQQKLIDKKVKEQTKQKKEEEKKEKEQNKLTIKKAFHSDSTIGNILPQIIPIKGNMVGINQEITVPLGFQIFVPSYGGLTINYNTNNNTKFTYEELLYKYNNLNFIKGNDGWKLYLPGDKVPNIIFDSNTVKCYTYKNSKVNKKKMKKCINKGNITPFCPLLYEQEGIKLYKYKKEPVVIIKSCSNHTLKDIFDNLKSSLDKADLWKTYSKKDIILIPFLNNINKPESNYVDSTNGTTIQENYKKAKYRKE